jgi:regulator of protease activity HflC (stomatin/prohibitin superfamily)
MAVVLLLLLALVVIAVFSGVKNLLPHERGVVYRLGQALPNAVGPGLVLTIPGLDRMVRVSLAEQKVEIPRATVTTGAESSQVDFTIAFRVLDPVRAATEVYDYRESVASAARRMIESTKGKDSTDIAAFVRSQLEDAARPWGIQIQSVNEKRFGSAR